VKVSVQRKDLEELNKKNRENRGSGGLVGIGGVGDTDIREGDKVEGTCFCPGGKLSIKGAKNV
jgi:hypothetical protein